jgi:cbb3-type cytochrome oxidase maturation protein
LFYPPQASHQFYSLISIIGSLDCRHFLPQYRPILLTTEKIKKLSALFLLIGISIIVAGGFLAAFLWSVNSGQYEDDYTPSVRILFDNEKRTNTQPDNKQPKTQNK